MPRSRRRDDRDEQGAIAIMVALVTTMVLLVVAALTVDIGHTWAKRGSLQTQVDNAAKLAAEQLPVESTTVSSSPAPAQLKVAEAAARYLACETVPGQRDLTPAIPACPGSGTSPAITTFARTLLANGSSATPSGSGAVRFPTVNQVEVTAPSARVAYGFGQLAGPTESIQTKSATAIALSPGEVLPVGLSLTCMASSLGTVPLGAGDTISTVMPVNYVSTGFPSALTTTPVTPVPTTNGLVDWTDITNAYNNSAGSLALGPSSIKPSGSVTLNFDWRGNRNGWFVQSTRIYIRKIGYKVGDPTGLYQSAELSTGLLEKSEGRSTITLNLPPGTYQALIRFTGTNQLLPPYQQQQWLNNSPPQFTIPETGELRKLVSCARPVQSPRDGFANGTDPGDRAAMPVNFAQGLDHGLQQFPGLGNAVDAVNLSPSALPSTLAATLANPSSLFACDSNARVKRDYPTRRLDGPNCLRVDTGRDWSAELTQGLLTGGSTFTGRLRCPSSGPCNFSSSRPVLSNPGGIPGTYNNDRFSDFILRHNGNPRYLNDPLFMSLHSFTSSSLPLVTPPNDTVDQALYDSPRFFWAPVMLSAYTSGAPGDYSVMTFRPVFLTPDSSSQISTPIDMLLQGLISQGTSAGQTLLSLLTDFGQSVTCLLLPLVCQLQMLKLADITAPLQSYLGSSTVNVGGLVIDSTASRVRAARIMTLAPDALPAVSREYDGPVTDYLGVGPKIIRLTR